MVCKVSLNIFKGNTDGYETEFENNGYLKILDKISEVLSFVYAENRGPFSGGLPSDGHRKF